MHVVSPCQVLGDCYGKRKEKGGVFVSHRATSSRSFGGLLNCEHTEVQDGEMTLSLSHG